MKRLLNILVFFALALPTSPQEETRIVDSLRNVLPTQEGREKVLTMIELTWEFYDVSYDDCLDWGEKAIKEAHDLGYADLEAKANYVLGIQYAYHGDLDLAKEYLTEAYSRFSDLGDVKNSFESLWNLATYELTLGSIDTAFAFYERALPIAGQLNDTSARAFILSNMALIWYKRGEPETANETYNEARRLFEALGDRQRVCRMEMNMAAISQERGQALEAKQVYWKILPQFDAFGDNYYSFLVCKNLGYIYENYIVDYDSAMFYLQKAVSYTEKPMPYRENEVFLNNEKSSAYVEMGNIMLRKKKFAEALEKFSIALECAELNAYYYGQMEACLGLIKVHSLMSQPEKSLHYYQLFSELEKKSGIGVMNPSLFKPLAIDYARLGRFADLESEIDAFQEQYVAAQNENAELHDQNRSLRHHADDLLQQYDSQSAQIETLQAQRNQYRLAFFGLLAIVFFALAVWIAYKIVRKKRAKNVKS